MNSCTHVASSIGTDGFMQSARKMDVCMSGKPPGTVFMGMGIYISGIFLMVCMIFILLFAYIPSGLSYFLQYIIFL